MMHQYLTLGVVVWDLIIAGALGWLESVCRIHSQHNSMLGFRAW